MNYQFFNKLPEEAKMIREKVFVEEQGFQNEFDEQDEHSWHLVIYDYRTPVGCARMFDEKGDIVFGRIAVIPEKRHKHLGSYILHELEKKARELGYPKAKLSAQVSAMGFYKKNGFQAYGEEYLDEFCPHIHMEKRL